MFAGSWGGNKPSTDQLRFKNLEECSMTKLSPFLNVLQKAVLVAMAAILPLAVVAVIAPAL